MIDGVIKFQEQKISTSDDISNNLFNEIEKWRKIVHQNKLIGHDQLHNVGYGNISIRANLSSVLKSDNPQFVISGSQTGHLSDLIRSQYVMILDYDFEKFKVITAGQSKASSESLTHAAFYKSNEQIGAIVHAHHYDKWQELINSGAPSTPKEIEYGTYELAKEVMKIVNDNEEGLLVTIGHEGGIFTYAKSLERATKLMLTATSVS